MSKYNTNKTYLLIKSTIIKILIYSVVLLALYIITINWLRIVPCLPMKTISINGQSIKVCLADNNQKRTKGLSNSKYLPKGWGMLFVFEDSGYHSFWMKDMKYNIDIIWLDERLKPVYFVRGAKPSDFPTSYQPDLPAKFVLETRPNFIK